MLTLTKSLDTNSTEDQEYLVSKTKTKKNWDTQMPKFKRLGQDHHKEEITKHPLRRETTHHQEILNTSQEETLL